MWSFRVLNEWVGDNIRCILKMFSVGLTKAATTGFTGVKSVSNTHQFFIQSKHPGFSPKLTWLVYWVFKIILMLRNWKSNKHCYQQTTMKKDMEVVFRRTTFNSFVSWRLLLITSKKKRIQIYWLVKHGISAFFRTKIM